MMGSRLISPAVVRIGMTVVAVDKPKLITVVFAAPLDGLGSIPLRR